jgi:hypothetical protein
MSDPKPIGSIAENVVRKFAALNQQAIDKARTQEEFIHAASCGCGNPIHTFHIPGEQLEGRLRSCENRDREDRAKTAHLFYHNAQGLEQCVAIRLTKNLWGTIYKNHLFGCYIRITYTGSILRPHFRHAEKLFLVEVDKGAIQENFERVQNYGRKSDKRRAVKIRRPIPVTAQSGSVN